MLGGVAHPYRVYSATGADPIVPALRGRYPIPDGVPASVRHHYQGTRGQAAVTNRCVPRVAADAGLPAQEPMVMGPFGVYRGAVTGRLYPPYPSISLPSIH